MGFFLTSDLSFLSDSSWLFSVGLSSVGVGLSSLGSVASSVSASFVSGLVSCTGDSGIGFSEVSAAASSVVAADDSNLGVSDPGEDSGVR